MINTVNPVYIGNREFVRHRNETVPDTSSVVFVLICDDVTYANSQSHKMQSSSSGYHTTRPALASLSSDSERVTSAPTSTDQGKMCTTSSRRKIRRRNRGGSETQFPGKLYDMLAYAEENHLDAVVSWIKGGRAFMVHDPEKLVELLPMFFGQTKYRSFRRQLNMWHFQRIMEGPDRGAFVHPCFIRSNKQLCSYMSRHVFTPPPAPVDLEDHSRYEEWRLESLKLDEPLALSGLNLSTTLKFESDSTTETMKCFTGFEVLEPNFIRLTESPIRSSSLDKLPGMSIAGLSDGDALFFSGRQFHFLDDYGSRPMEKHISSGSIKACNAENATVFQPDTECHAIPENAAVSPLDTFPYNAPMIVPDSLLEPIDPEMFDSLFSLSA